MRVFGTNFLTVLGGLLYVLAFTHLWCALMAFPLKMPLLDMSHANFSSVVGEFVCAWGVALTALYLRNHDEFASKI